MLGSWVGTKEDVNMRLRRACGLWENMKEQLKNEMLHERWQKKDVKRLQISMDKC